MKRIKLAAIITGVGLMALSCARDDHVGPPVEPSLRSQEAQEDRPFYYYQQDRVYLDVDTTSFIVKTDLVAPAAALRDVLSGLPEAATTSVMQAAQHYMVRLPVGITRDGHRAALARLRADNRFQFAAPALRSAEYNSSVTLVNRLAVQFKGSVGRGAVDSLLQRLNLTVLREPAPDSGFFSYVLRYPHGADPLAIAAEMHTHPLVEWADPDKISDRRQSAPSDPYYPLQYYLRNTVFLNGVRVDDNVEMAWTITKGSSSIKVYVIDDGVDLLQQDVFSCGSEASGFDTFWPDVPPDENAFQPHPADGHGTSVAGIIASCHDNGLGTAGIAPATALGAVRIFRNGSLTLISESQMASTGPG
ncbi:MAG: S8 family serine peptidase [bacterium]